MHSLDIPLNQRNTSQLKNIICDHATDDMRENQAEEQLKAIVSELLDYWIDEFEHKNIVNILGGEICPIRNQTVLKQELSYI
jgi:hypothetical protein